MSWFEKLLPSRIRTDGKGSRHNVPEGLWSKCPRCQAVLYRAELERHLNVCPRCNHHLRIGARCRLNYFLDSDIKYFEKDENSIDNYLLNGNLQFFFRRMIDATG